MKNSNKKESNGALSIILLILLLFVMLYGVLVGFLEVLDKTKEERKKVAAEIGEICPKCNGLINFIGGYDFDIDLGGFEFELDSLGLRYETYDYVGSNVLLELKNNENINIGLEYLYDVNTDMFYLNGGWINLEDLLGEFKRFENIEVVTPEFNFYEFNNLDYCFDGITIDLGQHSIKRIYNYKVDSKVYVVEYEDKITNVDTSIGGDYKGASFMYVFEYTGKETLDLKERVIKNLKIQDLDGEWKVPTIEIIEPEGLDLVDSDYKFHWQDPTFVEDVGITIVAKLVNLVGNEYVAKIGTLFLKPVN